MTLRELLQISIEEEYTGLKSLIMFLVFEKKVLSLDSADTELDLYFQANNHERMKQLLTAYQKDTGIKHKLSGFLAETDQGEVTVVAVNEREARKLLQKNRCELHQITMLSGETIMEARNRQGVVTIRANLNTFISKYDRATII
ncbi:hypothetical protein F9U64_17915 [Gracilibacillus oryzae]|uniref:Uncharacterized protein n=1 Tax=Gracilibacillus oryzae TaxID=1672701 RepID=A0A7C8GRI3_9BACI|nr:hypothetical protein [Gracilibacillus oryzae]KAB8127388.1 hypothetical protein F9U64_17915 [Gracilibacillus oryzae]